MVVNTTQERIEFIGVDKISQATKTAKASVGDLKSSLDEVKSALAAIGITIGAGAMLKMALDTNHAVAALDDMAESTGASVERLSALQRVAQVGGHDFEGLTATIGKMIKGLKGVDDDGQKATHALEFLGVKAKDLSGHFKDPALLLEEVAQKLSKYSDNGNKVALVQDILGKGAERYLPFLKDLAENTDKLSTVTAKQAAEAEAAEKNIKRLQLQFADARRELVISFTPAVVDFTDKLLKAKDAAGGLGLALVTVLTQEVGPNIPDQIEKLGKEIQAKEIAASARVLHGAGGTESPEDAAARVLLGITISDLKNRQAYLQKILDQQRRDLYAGLAEDASGNVGPKPAEPKEQANYESQDPKKERERAAFVAKQVFEDEERLRKERAALDAYNDSVNNERAKAILQALEIQRGLDAYILEAQSQGRGTGEEENTATAIGGADRTARLEKLRDSLKEEAQLENEFHNQQLADLQGYYGQELDALGGRQAVEERLELDHAARLFAIRRRSLDQLAGYNRSSWQGQTLTVLGEMQEMTAGVAQHSRLLFEINKIATLASIAIKAPSAIAASYEFGAKFGGPPLGAVMAGIAAAAMAAQAAAAASVQFGGGTAPSVSSTPAPPVTPVGATTEAAASGAPKSVTLIIKVEGAAGRAIAEDLAKQLLDLKKDGGFPDLFNAEVQT